MSSSELTNLLPPERIKRWKNEYFVRLATTAFLALTGVVVAGVALLVPSYLSLHLETKAQQARIQELDATLATSNGKETTARLAALNSSTTYLARLATTTTATNAVRGVLSAPRTGIILTDFTYTPAPPTGGKMVLTGVAATREHLRAYKMALSALPFVSAVELPISVYAKESNIPFTINLSGSLLP